MGTITSNCDTSNWREALTQPQPEPSNEPCLHEMRQDDVAQEDKTERSNNPEAAGRSPESGAADANSNALGGRLRC
jgi:hypothetical protein